MKKTEQAMLKALIVSNLIFAPLFIFGQSRYVLIDSLFVNDAVRVNEVKTWCHKHQTSFSIFNIMFRYPAKYSTGGTSLLKPETKYLISITAYPDFDKGKTVWENVSLQKIDKSKIINYRDLEKEIVPRLRNYDTMMNDSVLIDRDLALLVKRADGYYVSKSGTCAEFYEITNSYTVYAYPGAGKLYELNKQSPVHFPEDYFLNKRRGRFAYQVLQFMFLSKKRTYYSRIQEKRFRNIIWYDFWRLNKDGIGKMLVYDDYTGIIGATIERRFKQDVEISDKICTGDRINGMSLEEYYTTIGALAESKNESEID